MRASPLAQWQRVCLPRQETRVRSLVQGDHTCRGAPTPERQNWWARALRSGGHNYGATGCSHWSPRPQSPRSTSGAAAGSRPPSAAAYKPAAGHRKQWIKSPGNIRINVRQRKCRCYIWSTARCYCLPKIHTGSLRKPQHQMKVSSLIQLEAATHTWDNVAWRITFPLPYLVS